MEDGALMSYAPNAGNLGRSRHGFDVRPVTIARPLPEMTNLEQRPALDLGGAGRLDAHATMLHLKTWREVWPWRRGYEVGRNVAHRAAMVAYPSTRIATIVPFG